MRASSKRAGEGPLPGPSSESAGDPAAGPFEGRLIAEIGRLDRFCSRRYGIQADDIVQEALLRALDARDTFDVRRPIWPWMRTIAVHAARSRRSLDGRLETVSLEDAEPAFAGNGPGPQGEAAALLDRLGPVERDTVDRFYLRGLTIAEIASERRCPSGTVKSQLSRARRRLSLILGGAGLLVVAALAPRSHDRASHESRPVVHSSSVDVRRRRPSPPRFLRVDHSQPDSPTRTLEWVVTGATVVRAGLIQPHAAIPSQEKPHR